jgi:membrane-associated phospholipid phosphatase
MKINTNGIGNGEHQKSRIPAIVGCFIMAVMTLIVCIPSVFEYLRVTSLEYIIVIRKDYSHDYSDFFMNLLSAMGDKYGIFIMNCVALAVLNQTNYLMLLNVSSVSVGLNIIIKMMIRDARPYFYTSEYQPVSCDFEYGSPSGHAQSVTSFYLSLVTLIIKQYNIKGQRKTIYYIFGYFY